MKGRIGCSLVCLLASATLGVSAWGREAGQETVTADPWENFNRKIFQFNEAADRWVLKPVARGYRKITPDPVEQGVSNFYSNLWEVRNVLNDVLQWKWVQAGNDTGRFLINSTIGIAGVFDVAQHMNLERNEGEDFGQTLAVWGVDSGPYLVLPFLGPSTVRDGAAIPVDWLANPIEEIDHRSTRNSLIALGFVSARAELIQAEAFISGDRYVFIREAYLQRRNYLVNDGEVEDDFDDFGDFDGNDYGDYE
jgi:phospholipid-binding lipoprotein MlaA